MQAAAWHGCLHRVRPPGQRHTDACLMHLQHGRSRPRSNVRRKQCVKPAAALVGAAGAQDWGLWALLAGCGACGQVRESAAACTPLLSLSTAGMTIGIAACCLRASQLVKQAVGMQPKHGSWRAPSCSWAFHCTEVFHCCSKGPLATRLPESELLLARRRKTGIMFPSSHADLGATHHFWRTPVCSTALNDGRPAAGYC